MAHIFISYSRRDLDFAQKIVDALGEHELETWIDWKSIPKGEDWEQEIYRAIEGADALLFLISPDSVRSRMCNKEIIYAVKNSKRILPILLHEVDTDDFLDGYARAEIKKRNWIFCREGQDDFTRAIDITREAIRTDYEWLRFHTILLTKALAWQRANRDGSRLLRGKELREAEAKTTEVGIKTEPVLTEVEQQYLQSSRRAASRQRRLPFAVVLGVISALALFIIWIYGLWYSFVPIRTACPATTQLGIQLSADGLSPEIRQVLETARLQSSTETSLRYCDETTLAGDTTMLVNAFPQGSKDRLLLEIRLPDTPAYQLDFLPEVRQLGPETVSVKEAEALIRAASAYSLGEYELTASILRRLSTERDDETMQMASLSELTLLAQSYLFLNDLERSQPAYELALTKSEPGSEMTSRLNMGAALAYWRPLLYNSSYPDRAQACRMSRQHYDNSEAWFGAEAYINNVKIVYANEFHCNDGAWKDLPDQLDEIDAEANSIAYLIRANACTVDEVLPGCDYLAELSKAEAHVLFARALLIRHYYQRIDTVDHCSVAEPLLESFRKEIINPMDIAELRALLRIRALNCG